MSSAPERVVIIGYGAIGRALGRQLSEIPTTAQLAAIITSTERVDTTQREVSVPVFKSVDGAMTTGPSLFVECGGHSALRAHARAVLRAGTDLLIASVGALADSDLEHTIRNAADESGAHVLLPSGAIGGLDALGAARFAGLDQVSYNSRKATRAWRGTYAEELVDLGKISNAVEFFRGNARDAARLFPQNANVAAAVALSGLGFEATTVTLTADPAIAVNRHHISARGAFGSLDVTVEGRPLPDNPKTSMLAPMSLLKAIISRNAAVCIV